ncbi:hypothetical protein K490DRAFT_67238 [Saccharata proteae CBS 121410]|uniref:Protein-lysine N-methyltransferase EFM6 n=1 Tax=Saccharata proteae CBS 121410 TaxID=1314787 RepID=A0A9P4LXC7_9PEZI|nr:hypothetical protein K490DRAFT_67238 [Saccharata proteae CBS 121410]
MASSDSEDFSPFNISTDLAPLPVYKPAGTAHVDFDSLLPAPGLALREDLATGCGGQLWPAGMVLAKYMLRYQREGLRGKKILELGAGGGLVGLAVALGCQGFREPLWITDMEAMDGLMRDNIMLNQLGGRVEAKIYNWGEPAPRELRGEGGDGQVQVDTVLAADCVYFEPAFPLLLQTLEDVIGEGTTCWFCFKKRRRADLHFVKQLKKKFEVVEVSEDVDREVYKRENLFLYKITRKAPGAAS